jgi:hypothetical protein
VNSEHVIGESSTTCSQIYAEHVFPTSTQTSTLGAAIVAATRCLHLKLLPVNGTFTDYYSLLGIPQIATERDITNAYRKKALSDHPDKTGGGQDQNDASSHMNNARDILLDPGQRKQYNALLTRELAFRARISNQFTPSVPNNIKHTNSSFTRTRTSTPKFDANANCKPDFKPEYFGSHRYPNMKPDHRSCKEQSRSHGRSPLEDDRDTDPHRHQVKDSKARPDFIPQKFPVTYSRFIPPASAYPVDPKKDTFGTKPRPKSPWAKFAYKGSTLGAIHENACASAIECCRAANEIKKILEVVHASIPSYNYAASWTDVGLLSRLSASAVLATELMYYVSARYFYHKTQIDDLVQVLGFRAAAEKMEGHQDVLGMLCNLILSTRNAFEKARGFVTSHVESDALVVLMIELKNVFTAWRTSYELPSNITEYIADVFSDAVHIGKDKWILYGQKPDGQGYQIMSFKMLKNPKASAPNNPGYEGSDEQDFGGKKSRTDTRSNQRRKGPFYETIEQADNEEGPGLRGSRGTNEIERESQRRENEEQSERFRVRFPNQIAMFDHFIQQMRAQGRAPRIVHWISNDEEEAFYDAKAKQSPEEKKEKKKDRAFRSYDY